MMLLIQSCQHAAPLNGALKKVNSDMYPDKITRAEYHHQIALGYRSAGLFEKAIETFRLAILHDPQFGPAHLELAHTYIKMERYSLAGSEVDRFLQLQTPTVDEVAFINELYVRTGSYNKAIQIQGQAYKIYQQNSFLWTKFALEMEVKNFDQAEKTLDILKDHHETIFLVEMARAELKIQQKKFEDALIALKAADMDRPNQELTLRHWIKVANELQVYDQAIIVSKRYFRFHRYNLQVSKLFTQAAVQSENYDLALDELAIQKFINPWDYSIDYQMAYVFFMKKDYGQAESLYTELYSKTDSEQSLYFLIQIQIAKNNIVGASKLIQNLAVNSDFYSPMQIQIAQFEWKNNQREKAIKRMEEAHFNRSDSLNLQREYAQLLIWENRYREASAVIEKGREFYPEDIPLAALAASIHFMLDDQNSFQKEIDYVLKNEPNNPDYYVMMSELWYKKNQPASEVEMLAKKAVALNSNHPNIKPLLAWALLKQDKLTEAVQIFEKLYDENPQDLFFAQALSEIYAKNNLRTATKEMISRTLNIRLNSNHSYNTYFEEVNQVAKMNVIAGSENGQESQSQNAEAQKSVEPSQQRLPASLVPQVRPDIK